MANHQHLSVLQTLVHDENRVVSYKLLSQKLNVNVNLAKQMLYEFITSQKTKENQQVHATYCVTGQLGGQKQARQISVIIVPQEKLDETLAKFEATRVHVYSVQPCALKDPNSLVMTNMECLENQPMPELSGIISKDIKVVDLAKKMPIRPPTVTAPKTKPVAEKKEIAKKEETKPKPTAKKSSMQGFFNKGASTSSTAASKPSTATSKKSSSNASNASKGSSFFKSNSTSNNQFTTNSTKEEQETRRVIEDQGPLNIAFSDDEEDLTDKKRKRRVVADEESDNDEGDRSDDETKRLRLLADQAAEQMEEEEELDVDVEMDDKEKETEPQVEEPQEPQEPQKRRRKVIRTKTFKDERGYLLTKDVEEWVTDDEAPAQPVAPKPAEKKSAFANKSSSFSKNDKKPAGKGKKAPAKNQPSIASFFGKK